MRMMVSAALASGLVAATPALAEDGSGYRQIAAGNLAGAEQTILAEQRMFPNDADLMVNLAYLYARSGRIAEARALYTRVLALPADALDLPDGRAVSSHAVAALGLQQLAPTQTAAR